MFEFFRKPKEVVRSELPVVPADQNRAEVFVRQAKRLGANGVIQPMSQGIDGRVIHSSTPVASDAEAKNFGKIDPGTIEANLQNADRDLTQTDPRIDAVHARVMRAGYFDLDEQVKQVPDSAVATEPFSHRLEQSSVFGEQFSLDEQRTQQLKLKQAIQTLEAQRDATDEPARWGELNLQVKQLRGEHDKLTAILARTLK